MKRIAFKMKLYPGCAREYKKRHDEIWPELARLLSKTGIREYSIFLDEVLFAYCKIINSIELDTLPTLAIMQKWWAHMSDVMETNPDHSPIVTDMTEMFYLP